MKQVEDLKFHMMKHWFLTFAYSTRLINKLRLQRHSKWIHRFCQKNKCKINSGKMPLRENILIMLPFFSNRIATFFFYFQIHMKLQEFREIQD